MALLAYFRKGVIALALGALSALPVAAQDKVSVRSPDVNLRAGPDAQSEILFKLAQGYPLQVLERRGDWLHVQDFEGDQGWIAQRVTLEVPHHIVRATQVNLRSGPGPQHPVVGRVNYGDVLKTLGRQDGWVQVHNPQDQSPAWVAEALVWGW